MSQIKKFFRFLFYSLLPYKKAINRNYKATLGYEMNWSRPSDINEKINWLKVYGDTSQWGG